MKNNLPALWLGTAMITAAPAMVLAQSPATISFPQGGAVPAQYQQYRPQPDIYSRR